jgi:acetyl/propionyl-CoA carboxylase alpha subunit
VEHGVTELVTDLDLVAEQLWIAAGEPLSDDVRRAAASAATPTRHAIEVRLAAEDPSREFAPVPGRVGRWSMPAGPGVRVDTATRPGDRIPPDYDPMIAKVMTVGRDRTAAIRRMRRALEEIEVTGVQTTLPFARGLVRDDAFLRDDGTALSTDWVADRWDGAGERARVREVAAIAVARAAAGSPAGMPSLRKDSEPRSGWARTARQIAIDRWPR